MLGAPHSAHARGTPPVAQWNELGNDMMGELGPGDLGPPPVEEDETQASEGSSEEERGTETQQEEEAEEAVETLPTCKPGASRPDSPLARSLHAGRPAGLASSSASVGKVKLFNRFGDLSDDEPEEDNQEPELQEASGEDTRKDLLPQSPAKTTSSAKRKNARHKRASRRPAAAVQEIAANRASPRRDMDNEQLSEPPLASKHTGRTGDAKASDSVMAPGLFDEQRDKGTACEDVEVDMSTATEKCKLASGSAELGSGEASLPKLTGNAKRKNRKAAAARAAGGQAEAAASPPATIGQAGDASSPATTQEEEPATATPPVSECPVLHGNGKLKVRLSDEKAKMLAMMTARMHEGPILRYMRKMELRKMVLAVPVDAAAQECTDMLDIILGIVVHCEASESSGDWALGSVIAPQEYAEQRGCFKCEDMRPIVAEVRSNRFGDELEWTHGLWAQVGQLQPPTTQARLRQKAFVNRLKATRTRWESQARGK